MEQHRDAPQSAVAGDLSPPVEEPIAGKQATLFVWLVLGLALVLRLWGLEYGLPSMVGRPDEEKIIGPAAAVVREGRYVPTTLIYPSLLIYVDALVLALSAAARRLLGRGDLFDVWPRVPYLICRGVSVVAGVATVFVTERLGRAFGLGATGGAIAAAIVATNYLHVRDSHWATADAALTFFAALALWLTLLALRGPSSWLLGASAAAGLAASTKYQGVIALAGPLVAIPWIARGVRAGLRRAVLVVFVAALCFCLTSPYQVKRWQAVVAAIAQSGHNVLGYAGERGYSVHARLTLPVGFGWPVLAVAALGLGLGLRRRERGTLVLLAFAAPWTMSIVNAGWVFPRYVTPLVPVLAVLAACGACALKLDSVPRLGAALVLLCGPGLWHSIQFDRIASRLDTRVLAARWIDENLPGSARVAACGPYGEVVFDTRRCRIVDCARLAALPARTEIVVLPSHPQLDQLVAVSPTLRQAVTSHGRLLVSFDPFLPGGAAWARFYTGDAFFIPFSGLEHVVRGGPALEVWALDSAPPEDVSTRPR